MFRSRRRSVLIPQHEHAQLSAVLARAWGNAQFALPGIDFELFVQGVAEHDRGYPQFDTAEIGATAEAAWIDLQRRGCEMQSGEAQVDLVIQFHIRRLVGYSPTPLRKALSEEINEIIARRLHQNRFEPEPFAWADQITHFCDKVSFDFCFEVPAESSVAVAESLLSEPKSLRYRVDGLGQIEVSPWPFRAPELRGEIAGFRAEGYPSRLETVQLPFAVRQGA